LVGVEDLTGGFVRLDLARQGVELQDTELEVRVAAILQHVRLVVPRLPTIVAYARKYDATEAGPEFEVLATEEELCSARLSAPEEAAIDQAIDRVRRFHEAQLTRITAGLRRDELGWAWDIPARALPTGLPMEGTGRIGQRLLPVLRAGVYAPGGLATYPSSLVMNAVPALVAGVREIVLATPARPDGSLSPAVLYTAKRLGISRVIKAGGAYGIGALAYGTDDGRACEVIAGPGNRYVNEAKRQLWGKVGLDGFAGPSEVVVLLDESAEPRFAAADILTQIEHAPDNFGCLIARSSHQLGEVMRHLENQLLGAPREAVMRQALAERGVAIVVERLSAACEFVNRIAPEHLSLLVADAVPYLAQIRNAGCVLVGPYSAQSSGDFVAGPSHTLPTNGGARFGSPTNVTTFLKFSSLIHLEREDLSALLPAIREFGAIEGFPAHARAAAIRFETP
jgi:histidinol dehydrogenase